MQNDPRVPMHVAYDSGQGESASFLYWERAQRGVMGLQSYPEGRLHLCCHFCEAAFSVPHSPEDKRPFSARLWRRRTGSYAALPFSGAVMRSLAFSPVEQVLAGRVENSVRLWNVRTGTERRDEVYPRPLESLAFSPDGRNLAVSGSAASIRLINLTTNAEVVTLDTAAPGNGAVAFSADGRRLAAGGVNGEVALWIAGSTEILQRPPGREPAVP